MQLTVSEETLSECVHPRHQPVLPVSPASVCSLQPDGVQPERLPHLRGPDQSPESDPVLRLQRRVGDRLERPGRGGNRALPDTATVSLLKTQLKAVKVA